MNLHLAFQTFLACLGFEQDKTAAIKLEEIARYENLDEFLGVEDLRPGLIQYSTTHGFRFLYSNDSALNQFVVAKKGKGFAKARNLPYIYL